MPVNTFASTGNSVFHDGKDILFVANLAIADTVSQDTSNLALNCTDLTNLNANPLNITFTNGNLRDAMLGKLSNASINDSGTILTINLSGFVSANAKILKVRALENTKDGAEQQLINTIVAIKSPPSAPVITPKLLATHGVTGDGTGVTVSGGSILVTLAPSEDTSKLIIHHRGTDPNGNPFADIVGNIGVAPLATNVNINLTSGPLQLLNMKADTNYYLSIQSENVQGESAHSNSLSFKASVRQASPVLLTAKSLENLQVTLTGTVSVPSANAYYSILALDSWDNQLFYQTNVVNVALNSLSKSTFTQAVTTFKGSNLVSGTVYYFAAIQHSVPLSVNNNQVPLDVTSPNVPLTQSSQSNVYSAVPVAYVPSNVGLTASQSLTADNKLVFSPSFINAGSIPQNMNVFFEFKINGVSKGVISNDTNNYSFPAASFYTVTNPPPKAAYEFSVKLDYLLSTNQVNGIVGTSSLPIYTDPSTYFNYASVKQFSNTVTQHPSTKDVPLPVDFALQNSNVGSIQCLAGSWSAPDINKMAELKLTVKQYEINLIKGVAGNPNGFDPSSLLDLNTNGDKTLTVDATTPSNGGSTDAPEYSLLKMFSAGTVTPLLPGIYTARVRVMVSSDSGDIPSNWTTASYELLEQAMSPPNSVTVTSALTPADLTGSSVSVGYSSVPSASITGRPQGWSGASATAAKISLYNQDGKIVYGPVTKPFTPAELAAAPNGNYSSSTIISGLSAGVTVYARINMVYVRVSASGEQMNEVKEGAIAQSAAYNIKSNVSIKTVKLTQTPVSTNPRGLDPNGGTSFKVDTEVDLGNNDSNGVLVKVVMPGLVGGITSYVHDASYDAAKKAWTVNLTPSAGYDYSKNPVTVIAISSQNTDAKSF